MESLSNYPATTKSTTTIWFTIRIKHTIVEVLVLISGTTAFHRVATTGATTNAQETQAMAHSPIISILRG